MFCLNTGISASNTEFNMNYTHKKHNNQNIFKQRKRGAYRRQNTIIKIFLNNENEAPADAKNTRRTRRQRTGGVNTHQQISFTV